MKIGGSDMADTAKWFCTNTGPQRVALARQAQGLPRLPTGKLLKRELRKRYWPEDRAL